MRRANKKSLELATAVSGCRLAAWWRQADRQLSNSRVAAAVSAVAAAGAGTAATAADVWLVLAG